jgi:cytochrome P450
VPTPAATLDSASATLRDPPRIASRHPLGSWPRLSADPVKFMLEATREHGDVVAFRIGPIQAVLVRDPEAIKHVMVDNNHNYDKATRGYDVLRRFLGNGLLTSEGDFWRRQRRIAQPAFHRKRIAGFAETMVGDTLDMLTAWERTAAAGQTIDMSREMMALTLRIVGKTLSAPRRPASASMR